MLIRLPAVSLRLCTVWVLMQPQLQQVLFRDAAVLVVALTMLYCVCTD